jgi:3-oxoacyl-[acyl-carrier-protein] synthase III
LDIKKIRVIASGHASRLKEHVSASERGLGLIGLAGLVVAEACAQAIQASKANANDATCLIVSASLRGREFPYPSSMLHACAKQHANLEVKVGTVFLEDLRTASHFIVKEMHRYVLVALVELLASEEELGDSGNLAPIEASATVVLLRSAEERERSAFLRFDARTLRVPEVMSEGTPKKAPNFPARIRWSQQPFKKKIASSQLQIEAPNKREGDESNEDDEVSKPRPFELAMNHLMKFVFRLIDDAGATPSDIGLVVWNRTEVLSLSQLVTQLRHDPSQFADGIDQVGLNSSLSANLHDALTNGRVRRGDQVILLEVSERVLTGAVITY